MNSIKKILSFFDNKDIKNGFIVLIVFACMAIVETFGVASLIPFLTLLGNPDAIESNVTYASLYDFTQNFGINNKQQFFLFFGFFSLFLIIFSGLLRVIAHYMLNSYLEIQRFHISRKLFNQYLSQDYSFFLSKNGGDLVKNVISEVDQIIGNFIRPVFVMLAYVFVIITISALLIFVNPLIAFVTSITLGGTYFAISRIIKRKLELIGSERLKANQMRFKTATEAFNNIKEIKIFGSEKKFREIFDNHSEKFAKTYSQQLIMNDIPKFIVESIAIGSMLIIIIYFMIISIGDNQDKLATILPIIGVYAFSVYRLQPSLQAIFRGTNSLKFSKSPIANLFKEFTEYPIKDTKLNNINNNKISLNRELSLRNIHYSYSQEIKPIFADLNLVFKANKITGIIGTSGSGKTTLVDIIISLINPDKGSVWADDEEIGQENFLNWQRGIGYVAQDVNLLDLSISENIAFGIPANAIDHKKVEYCAKIAQIHEFITTVLPNKYDTIVGEKGKSLSGGQRQRIGIARALYNDPTLIILDEATSALDSIAEKEFLSLIDSLSTSKTIILVTHKLEVVKKCDNIIVIDKGKIVDQGSFKDLKFRNSFLDQMR